MSDILYGIIAVIAAAVALGAFCGIFLRVLEWIMKIGERHE